MTSKVVDRSHERETGSRGNRAEPIFTFSERIRLTSWQTRDEFEEQDDPESVVDVEPFLTRLGGPCVPEGFPVSGEESMEGL